ncbi:hypothetical protein IT408_00895 [Candidatus Uhrbacteria bacterium]|nr:hypothetical protein [Candidatus Uhrbacteria bacterium]
MSSKSLNQIHIELLELHKALLEFEKRKYEVLYGKIDNPYTYLDIVMKHPTFAWLRILSEAIVTTDGLEKEENQKQDFEIKKSIKNLLTANEKNVSFTEKYLVALQESPEIAYAHGKVMKLL